MAVRLISQDKFCSAPVNQSNQWLCPIRGNTLKVNVDNNPPNAMNKGSNNRFKLLPDECEMSISNRAEPNYANSASFDSNSVINVDNSDTEQPNAYSDKLRKNKQRQSEKSSNHRKTAGNIDTDKPNTSSDQSRRNYERQSERDSSRSNFSYGKSRENISESRPRREQNNDDNNRIHSPAENTNGNDHIQKNRKTVIIAGDSMIQHVYG